MKNYVRGSWVIVGIGLFTISVVVAAGASETASSWEQVKSKTAVAMDDLRDSLNRTLSHFP